MPPRVLPENARLVRVEDIDRAVKTWFSDVVDAHVTSPQGEQRDVAVLFASGERWVAAADRRGIRDRDGRLILPVIQVRRVGIDTVTNMSGLGTNVPRLQVSRQVTDKASQLSDADYLRPLSSRRLREGNVFEIWTVPFPVTAVLTYRVTVQAQFQHQMNEIVEKTLSKLEFFDVPSFVLMLGLDRDRPQGIPQGQGSTELIPGDHSPYELRPPLSAPYVVGYIEGELGDDGNLEEFTDQERIIQMQFSFKVPTALTLDPEGERPAAQRELTAFQVSLEDEQVGFVDDPDELDLIFGPIK